MAKHIDRTYWTDIIGDHQVYEHRWYANPDFDDNKLADPKWHLPLQQMKPDVDWDVFVDTETNPNDLYDCEHIWEIRGKHSIAGKLQEEYRNVIEYMRMMPWCEWDEIADMFGYGPEIKKHLAWCFV